MVIVQVGTNLGAWEIYENGVAGPVINENGNVHYDSCLSYVKKNKEKIEFLHLIEPLIECNEHILKSYDFIENKKIYNLAIVDNENMNQIEIYRPKNSKISGHSSYNKNHLIAHNHTEIEQVVVDCVTLNNFLEKFNIKNCDRLYVDTEGMDCLLLYNYDHNKYKTNYIEFEVIHSDGPYSSSSNAEKYINKLISDGFEVKKNEHDQLNLIAIR